ncbi:nitroreductase family deazaflavin-dependent oxidoreductase [Mycobacterium sp. SMC-4]|uniref:nitroreductase family deazaflavin-dependent oxidoreductase n=1 Tax=Mycobacterium sp. SMC-4 TaxID=2857059 RepID=UPI0021B3A5D3|nr:nitroreductase family deazaflavin-dependent oxidoreductase [Mycobacterium sp. SMC-4]UXA18088.1 nitroreductase family deazaflavin-dependent oxidoreductase [Mycobacterium sp. SMC-4]
MDRRLFAVLIALIALTALPLGLLVVGMRSKFTPVLGAVRRLNKQVTNPRVMRTAGTARARTSVIGHVGRSSGRTYQTPVDVVPTPSGYLVALPYGTRVDWLRNVLAAGSATVLTNGEQITVDSPTVVATDSVSRLIPARTLRTLKLFGVSECVHLERVTTSASPSE